MRFSGVGGAGLVAACALFASCRGPTEVSVALSTDVPCVHVRGSSVTVASFPDLEAKSRATASSSFCDAPTGDLGTLVVTPSGASNGEIAFRVVAGVGQPVETCVPPVYGPGCIVARRALRYVPHIALRIQVPLRAACVGIVCPVTQTCVAGACVDATLDPAACSGPDGCGESALGGGAPGGGPLADGGPGGDAGSGPTDGGPPVDAGPGTYTADFTAAANWTAFDMTAFAHALISTQRGAVFDGRYLYIPPHGFGALLRYDTQGPLNALGSWQLYAGTGIGLAGGVFDGRYVYFVPDGSSSATVWRYDTTGTFNVAASWSSFNLSALGVTGSLGASFDGRYVYLGPSTGSTIAVRYDTTQSFTVAASWQSRDIVGGSQGLVFDGRYLYAVPGTVTAPSRWDSTTSFTVAPVWQPSASAPGGLFGGTFDGRYVYYAKSGAGPNLLYRADTSAFGTLESSAGDGVAPIDFQGAVFDGRYVYFVPTGTSGQALVTRFDATSAGFGTPTNWSSFDATTLAGVVTPGVTNYLGGAFDGRYVYFIPTSGTILLRFDARTPPAMPASHHGSFL